MIGLILRPLMPPACVDLVHVDDGWRWSCSSYSVSSANAELAGHAVESDDHREDHVDGVRRDATGAGAGLAHRGRRRRGETGTRRRPHLRAAPATRRGQGEPHDQARRPPPTHDEHRPDLHGTRPSAEAAPAAPDAAAAGWAAASASGRARACSWCRRPPSSRTRCPRAGPIGPCVPFGPVGPVGPGRK